MNLIEENKGFKIVCCNCGFEQCEEKEDLDYDYDDNPYLLNKYYWCPNCGQCD